MSSTTGGTPEPEPPPPNDVLGYGPIADELDAGRVGLVWADAQAYADSPDKAIGRVSSYGIVPIDDVDSVRYNVVEMMRRARKEVVITSPYLIPGETGIETFRNSITRYGVKYTLVTNSLAATDEPVVHTGYRRYRPQMRAIMSSRRCCDILSRARKLPIPPAPRWRRRAGCLRRFLRAGPRRLRAPPTHALPKRRARCPRSSC